MPEPEQIELTVAIEAGAGPIRGQVRYPSGAAEAFAGWLELSTALEQARNHDKATPSSGDDNR
jgi:hypothetical protein